MEIVGHDTREKGEIFIVMDRVSAVGVPKRELLIGDYHVVHRYKDNAVLCIVCVSLDCEHVRFVRKEREETWRRSTRRK